MGCYRCVTPPRVSPSYPIAGLISPSNYWLSREKKKEREKRKYVTQRPVVCYLGSNLSSTLCLSKYVGGGRFFDGNLNFGLLELLAIHPQTGPHDIAGDNGTDAGGRSGDNEITRLERHDPGDVAEDLGDLEEHKVGRGILFRLAVDLEEELDVVGVGNRGLGDDLAQGQERIKALGNVPRQALPLRLVLAVSGCHVDREQIGYKAGREAVISLSSRNRRG